MLTHLVCFFCVVSFAFAQPPPIPDRLPYEKPASPTLVFLGPEAALRASLVEWHEVLEADPMLDFRVSQPQLIKEDTECGKSLGVWLRTRLKIKPIREAPLMWVLLGRDGSALLSGPTPPKVEALVIALKNAGEINPVQTLERFLKKHPYHAEARRDLILALRDRLILRLQKNPQPTPDQDYSATQDALFWGPIAHELGIHFSGSDWMAMEQGLDSYLPPGKPEQSSPQMRALYRKIHPNLVNFLRALPENPYAWTSLMRIERVLGDGQLTSILMGTALCPSASRGLPSFVFLPLARMVLREAQRSGEWAEALTVYPRLWEHVRLWLSLREPLPPVGANGYQNAMTARSDAWEHLLTPWIEALIRTNRKSEVSAVLASLDDSWSPLRLDIRLRSLAKAMNCPDQAKSWASLTQSLPPAVPAEGLMLGELTLLYQNQREPDREGMRLQFRKEGVGLTVTQASQPWVEHLRWPTMVSRWALVTLNGESVLDGETLIDAKALVQAVKEANLPTGMRQTESFLKAHPDHLMALAQLAGYYRMRAYAHWEQRRGGVTIIGRQPSQPSNEERQCWKSYLSVLNQILEHPLGTCPNLLRQCTPFYFSMRAPQGLPKEWAAYWEEELPEDFGVKDLARRALPRLESDLARRPSDTALWDSWITFTDLLDKSPTETISSLVPSPATHAGSWPPSNVLQLATNQLRRSERWLELVELLHPHWETGLAVVDAKRDWSHTPPGGSRNWNSELARALLEGYLHLGRLAEADRVLKDSQTTIPIGDLLVKAKQLGQEAWAQKWSQGN